MADDMEVILDAYKEQENQILELTASNEDLQDEVSELSREVLRLKRKYKDQGGGGTGEDMDDVLDAKEVENEELRSKLAAAQAEILKLKEVNNELKSHAEVYEGEKAEAEGEVRHLRKKVDELQNALTENEKTMRTTLLKSTDLTKEKKDSKRAQMQLYDENERLQFENKKMLEDMKNFEEGKQIMEVLIARLADEKDELELSKDESDRARDELKLRIDELEADLEDAQDKLQVALETDGQWEVELDKMQQEFAAESDRQLRDVERLNNQVMALEKENAVLKDSTLMGEKQQEVDALKKRLKESSASLVEMSNSLEILHEENRQLAERISSLNERMEQHVADRIAQERESARILHKKLESAMSRIADEERRRMEAEARVAELMKEKDFLLHWKVVYENGHGLQELARHQKKMKEDQRRMELVIEKMSVQYSELTEAKALLEQSFLKLKEETGTDMDFDYPQEELSRETMSANGKLRLQVAELEEQIEALESDAIRLRKALKNQAGMVGEEGFKYAGMAPELLMKVNEFAANLRDGRLELPLDNRSSELLKKNKVLEEEIKMLKLTVDRYELELSGGGSVNLQQQLAEAMRSTMSGRRAEEEITALHEDVRNLLRVNDSLQHNLSHMQNEITMLLKQQIGKADGTTDGITAMLLASNESLMKELQEIREASSANALGEAHKRAPSDSDEASSVAGGGMATGHAATGQKQGGNLPPTGKKGATIAPGSKTSQVGPGRTRIQPQGNATPRGAVGVGGPASSMDLNATPRKGGMRQQFPSGVFTPGGNYATPHGGVGGEGYIPLQTPSTPHGRNMLTRTLAGMNLPPEEWADELTELNGQLIESLEQLFEREEELAQQRVLVENMESYFVEVKQQMTSLYFEYAQKADEWETREKEMKTETTALIAERDNLALKLKRVEEAIDMISAETNKGGDTAGTIARLEDKIKEYTRKVTVYEVNEAVLSRKFMALSEQMAEEQSLRARVEADFVEMEGTLKRRILFLEQYKAICSPRLDKLETELQYSVPQSDFIAIQNELESLREDHLFALRRELEARVGSFDSHERGREVRILKNKILHLEAEVARAKQGLHNCHAELENQKAATQRIVDAQNAPPVMDARGLPSQAPVNKELGVLVSEMAKYRGDASRLEVELVAANHKCQLLETRLRESNSEVDCAMQKIAELEERNESAELSERAALKEHMNIKLKYDGGLTAEEATAMKGQAAKYENKISELEQSVAHLKEMAEIATQQAQTLSDFRDAYQDELKVLREHVAVQESRSDDDLIIGRLQRQLMATKTAYKTFTRKYHLIRGNLRQRELTERIFEHRLDQREEFALKLQETHRLEVAAMKKALRSVYESLISGAEGAIYSKASAVSESGASKEIQSKDVFRSSVDNAIALKKMLQRVTGVGGVLAGRVTISDKLASMSEQIGDLSALAESSGERADSSDKRCVELEAECERLREDGHILRRTIRDMNDILDAGGIGAGTGAAAVASKKNIHAQTKAIAARVLGLNEEVRALKISSLQQKREVSLLQQDKKHLKHILARVEDDLRSLEEGRLMLDPHQNILGGVNADGLGLEDPLIAEFLKIREDLFSYEEDQDGTPEGSRGEALGSNSSPPTPPPNRPDGNTLETSPQLRLKTPLRVSTGDEAEEGEEEDGSGITKHELLDKIEGANAELLAHKRDSNNYKRKMDSLHTQVLDLQGIIDEKDEQIAYYERMATAEGLPTIRGNMSVAVSTAPRGKEWRMMREEQEKLQEAASATLGSMRSLLEGKNKELERCRAKLEALQSAVPASSSGVNASGGYSRRGPSLADRRAEDLLKRLEDEERYNRGGRRRRDEDEADKSLVQRLMDQIDHADVILQEKIKTVSQLEQKLMIANNQREKAEHRCGASLKEMEAMKVDMVTLVEQLKGRDEAYIKLAQYNQIVDGEVDPNKGAEMGALPEMLPIAKVREMKRKNLELQKDVHTKNEKIKQYRAIIVSLKEEFIKSEEERAISEVSNKQVSEQRAVGGTEMESLRAQVSALRDGLRQAKTDLDTARAGREKLVKARQAALEEGERLEGQVARAEAQASAAQEALHRCRRDLEESRRKEVRLREKLKDIGGRADGEGEGVSERGTTSKPTAAGLERLQREIEILRSENVALRRAVAGTGGDISRAVAVASSSQPDDESTEEGRTGRRGVGAGGGGTVPHGGVEELRQQLHVKWEAEKKLQKRITTLEKRLQEKLEECDDLQAQLRRQKDMVQQHQAAVLREKKKNATAGQKPPKLGSDEILAIDEMQTRLFDLENHNEALRRRAEVQLPNELAKARHQVDVLTNRLNSVESELEDSEMRRKQLAAVMRDGGGGDFTSLRASEDRYLREEMLKDELNSARKIRLELEASLLERDSQAMEMRFDVEAKEVENSRLRRRVKELENMCRSLGGNVGADSAARSAGSRFDKERDTETVVETMRKAIDKLKAENDRLRRGIGTEGGKIGDAEKRLTAERKKNEKLQEELKTMESKVNVLESGGQKLIQKQQQVASLRKQLKSREDTITDKTRRIKDMEDEVSGLQKSASDSYSRIQQLELQVASKALGRDGSASKKPSAEFTATSAEVTELRRRSSQQALEIESMRTQLAEARRELIANRQGVSGDVDVDALKDQLNKANKENARLKNELSAFDLDFFEEIENLKYAHAESTRKLREMERKFGPLR